MDRTRKAGLRHFNRAYRTGEHGWPVKEPSPFVIENLKRLRRLVPGGRLLDIGCGEGRHSIAARRMGFRVVGVDFAPLALKRARRFTAEAGVTGIVYRQADVLGLPFPEGSFDAVVDYGCLHHQRKRDWPAYKRSVLGVLKPRGYLSLSAFSPLFRVFAGTGRTWRMMNHTYRRCFTPESLREFCGGELEILNLAEERSPQRCFWHALLRRRTCSV
jgi:SAM-dependent methyltransferase